LHVLASRDGARGIDDLVELDPRAMGSPLVLGPLPARELYALAACGTAVYGLDASGDIYRGEGTKLHLLGRTGVAWWGAACSGAEVPLAPAPAEEPRSEPASAEREAEVPRPGEPARDTVVGGCLCG
jgi:hypothetical protein